MSEYTGLYIIGQVVKIIVKRIILPLYANMKHIEPFINN